MHVLGTVTCGETTTLILESVIRDVADCNEAYNSSGVAELTNVTVTYVAADAGSWTQANETCTVSCVVPGNVYYLRQYNLTCSTVGDKADAGVDPVCGH